MTGRPFLAELHQDDDFFLLAKSVGEFGERELTPYLSRLGAEEFPARFISLAANNGFVGSAVPAEYGGQSGTLEGILSIIEGIAACDGSLALTLAAHESLATTHILLGGNDRQKHNYLPRLTSGADTGAWCLTEPQAGSNIFHDMRTRLERGPEGWKLNGEKTFITNGRHAGLFVVLARALWEDGRDDGITACVVESRGNEDRIARTALHGKMGMLRSDTAALKFDDVPVTGDAILGPIGSGGKVARQVLLRGRVGISALALGLARDSLERAAVYSKERKVAGGSLFEQPLTQAKLSRMEESLWVAWQGVRSAARFADAQKTFKVQACMAKVFATETALWITDEAIQIMGGYGYMRDYKVEQNYRDARLLTIGEGASEILRFAIAANLLDQDRDNMGDILPNLDSLEVAARQYSGSMSSLWGPGWRALHLASESVCWVREEIRKDGPRTGLVLSRQCEAVRFADVATRLWISIQVVLAGARLADPGSASPKYMRLGENFLIRSSIEICHLASELLRALGVTDARLRHNYIEALEIGAAVNSPSPMPLIVEGS
ncbi:MAG: acyl-CoA dehydrogenase family protein [Terriglobia bacterium]|jgi:alkylation response protein AidB-like acyl-CoA dehydrogenase